MEIATITPVPNLELSHQFSHTYLVLGWLAKESEEYRNFFRQIKKLYSDAFVIADNGANETSPLLGQELVDFAKSIYADEIIIPDVYHDSAKTIELSEKFLHNYFDQISHMSIMAVPQGKTKKEYLDSFNKFIDNDKITTIGIGYRNLLPAFEEELHATDLEIPKLILDDDCFKYTISRLYFIKKYILQSKEQINKKIHLLGLFNPYELYLHSKNTNSVIRSCDSATLCQAAQANVLFNNRYGVINKPQEYLKFHEGLSKNQMCIFKENVKIIKEWINLDYNRNLPRIIS